jgi:hypothetical protein
VYRSSGDNGSDRIVLNTAARNVGNRKGFDTFGRTIAAITPEGTHLPMSDESTQWGSPSTTTLCRAPLSATMFTRRSETLADGHALAQGEAMMIICSFRTISLRMLHSVTSVPHKIWLFASDQILTGAYELRLSRRILDLRNAVQSPFGFTRSDGISIWDAT